MDMTSKSPSCHLPNSADLLAWYDRHARNLPWRIPPQESKQGVLPDPYHIWLSEIMLQQTTIAAVKAYFLKFLALWPTVTDLAAASQDDVMKAWAGLGYYSRARNLHKCACVIVAEHDGKIPQTAEELIKLPGIGAYTSAAIASIAFGQAVAVVDGNVERVFTRLGCIETPLPAAKEIVRSAKQSILPANRPGDFAQAVMDLGATLCTPKKPACALCPWNQACDAFAHDEPERFPIKAPKQAKPTRRGAAFVITDGNGNIWLQKRGPKGLLASMTQIPTTDWSAGEDGNVTPDDAPINVSTWTFKGTAKHTFTHFHLELDIYEATIEDKSIRPEDWWCAEDRLGEEALPTVMKKAISTALPNAFASK